MDGGQVPRTKYRVYWATQPPPAEIDPEQLHRLIPVDFTTENDAVHAAALLLRAGDHVWLIERPDGQPMEADEIREKCAPLLALFNSRLGRKS